MPCRPGRRHRRSSAPWPGCTGSRHWSPDRNEIFLWTPFWRKSHRPRKDISASALPLSPSVRMACRPSWKLPCWRQCCSKTGRHSPKLWSWGFCSLFFSTQTPFIYCGGRNSEGINIKNIYDFIYKVHSHVCDLAFPHLQSGGMTAEVRRVDEAEAKDSDVATVKGSDVT